MRKQSIFKRKRGRPNRYPGKPNQARLTVSLTPSCREQISTLAERLNCSQSDVVELACGRYQHKAHQPSYNKEARSPMPKKKDEALQVVDEHSEDTATALQVVEKPDALMPIHSGADMVHAFDAYLELQKQLDKRMPEAIQTIKGKAFRKNNTGAHCLGLLV